MPWLRGRTPAAALFGLLFVCRNHRARLALSRRALGTATPSRPEPGSKSSVFVSSHFRLESGEVELFLSRKGMKFRLTSEHAIVKECPFCPAHKNDLTNLWKLYVWRSNGRCFCHRCGANYSYFEFRQRISGGDIAIAPAQDRPASAPVRPLDQQKAFESRSCLSSDSDVLAYLTEKRRLRPDVLRRFGVGSAEITFPGCSAPEKCVTFPWARMDEDAGFGSLQVDRLKYRSISQKSNQMLEPRGGPWGLFGWHVIPATADKIVITEGEFDAMSVYQETGLYAASLPNGANSFPIEILPCLERFKTIIIWMDDDPSGRDGTEKFARKVGLNRVLIVRSKGDQDSGPKDANEALVQGVSLSVIIESARKPSHNMILSVRDLRDDVFNELGHGAQYSGVPYRSLPGFQALLKGHRKGELTIVTGPTGLGKTTVLAQMSVDLCLQGTTTLWGSFEIKNQRLVKTMLSQYEGRNLDGLDRTMFDEVFSRFASMPLHFLKFFSITDLDDVIQALEFAVYVHDVDHILLDNLQFMLGAAARGTNKFDQQDEAISRLRHFATTKNVHISLVIHPRKEAPGQQLSVLSVFGSGKATQEADNVIILQPSDVSQNIRFITIGKNRFDGECGRVPYRFDRACRRIFELDSFEKNQLRLMINSVKQNQEPAQFVATKMEILPMCAVMESSAVGGSGL